MIPNTRTVLRRGPLAAVLVQALVRYGCAMSLIPIDRIRCDDVTDALMVRAYARSGVRDIEAFPRRSS